MYSQKDDVGEKPKLVARKSARLVSRHWDYGPVLQAADAGYEPESKLLYDCKRNAPGLTACFRRAAANTRFR
ncbi:hypothetical protein quinque_013836 [Culex quinquefasciatus]